MSDLIERLRMVGGVCDEAADELERLTKENEEHIRQINLRNDTIDDLRAELAALCNEVRRKTLLEAAEIAEQETISAWDIPKTLRRMAGVE